MASRGINKVILLGNLGQDPDVKTFPSGDQVASFTLATSETWRDKVTGETREKTEWHRVSVFGSSANYLASYARKGSQVYVEVQLQTRKWQDNNGQDRYATEVVVRWPNGSVQILGGNSERPSNYSPVTTNRPDNEVVPDVQDDFDDIPF